jgi:carboxyl-terminal processing protease
MTGTLRALLAALIVAVVAFGGALYIGYRTGFDAGASNSGGGIDVAAVGRLRDLFGGPKNGGQLVDLAFRQLERAYYQPLDSQTLLQGERAALQKYLVSRRVPTALPSMNATGDQKADAGQGAGALDYALAHYARTLGPNASDALTQTALRGLMSAAHDPYTTYLSPREDRGLSESLSGGNFGGVGVFIYQLKDGRILLQPIEGLPAWRSGLKPGEILERVDASGVKGLALDRIEELIRGTPGTTVQLTAYPIKHPSAHRTVSIVREIIHVPTVRAKMEGGYEYIRLSEFGESSADEVRRALLDGQAHGAKGYILDLRNNGGGLLDQAVGISSFFIPQGVVVSTINRYGARQDQEALGTAIAGLRPLVVLVNKYTASASEITAGAIQDYNAGTLIGTTTFGKGVVQSIYPLPNGQGALKITTARYVTPMGRDIAHRGIVPDVVIAQDPDPALIDTRADKQLAAAKARLAAHPR